MPSVAKAEWAAAQPGRRPTQSEVQLEPEPDVPGARIETPRLRSEERVVERVERGLLLVERVDAVAVAKAALGPFQRLAVHRLGPGLAVPERDAARGRVERARDVRL